MSELLKQHPKVCNSRKESHFFDDQQSWDAGLQFYERNFVNCTSEQITFDATPIFHLSGFVTQRIKSSFEQERFQALKFVLILREPVGREFSLYEHRLRSCSGLLRARLLHVAECIKCLCSDHFWPILFLH